MKTLRVILPLTLLSLLLMAIPVSANPPGWAEPATVIMSPEDMRCGHAWFGWTGEDPPVIQVWFDGEGLRVLTDNTNDSATYVCWNRIEPGQWATAWKDFDLKTPVTVQLLTLEEVCQLPFFPPSLCPSGNDQGAMLITHANSGATCRIDPREPPVYTNDIFMRVSPSGQVSLTCHVNPSGG